MGKTRNTGKLATQIQFDNSNNLVIGNSTSSSFNTSGSVNAIGGITGSIFGIGDPTSFSASISSNLVSIQSVTASNIARLSNLETKSASVDISISNINSVTASNIARLSNLETKSSSVDISVSSLNTFSASNGNTSLNLKTGSYATTGSNTFFGTQTYSGSVYIANDLIVQGSSSIQYISASSVSIGTNIVQLNTANPSVRFAGLTIIDSGSIGGSGSFLYDSVQDEFIFVHRGNGTNITSSHFVLGPETYDSLGNETYLTSNIIPKGTGKEHLIDSCIFDNGTTTCIKNNLVGTGTISGTTIYGSTTVCSPVGLFTSCIDVGGTGTFTGDLTLNPSGNSTITQNASTGNYNQILFKVNGTTQSSILALSSALYFSVNGSCTALTIASTGAATFCSTIRSDATNGLALGSVAGYRRLQYDLASTTFGFLTDTNSVANIDAGSATFNNNITIISPSSSAAIGTTGQLKILSSTGVTSPASDVYLQAVVDSATPGDRGTAFAVQTGRTSGIAERFRISSTGAACFASTVCVGGELVVNGASISVNCSNTTATDARINLYTKSATNGDRATIYGYNLAATTAGCEITYLAFGYCCTNNQGYINMQTKSGGAWCNTMSIINGSVVIGSSSLPRVLLDLRPANNTGQVLLIGEGGNTRTGFGLDSGTAGMRIFTTYSNNQMIDIGGIGSDGSTWTRNHRFGIAGCNSFLNECGGNVGIGVISPNYPLEVLGAGGDQSLAPQTLQIRSTNGTSGQGTGIRISSTGGSKETVGILSVENTAATNGDMVFRLYNGGATMNEKMRITCGGDVLIGCGNVGGIFIRQTVAGTVDNNSQSIGNNGINYMNRVSGVGLHHIIFNNGNNIVGSITSCTTATQFNTTSDYRLKTDLKNYNGICLINQIKTYDFAWKLNDARTYGVIAHELSDIIPYAVTGEKDALDERGCILPQSVDYSKIVTPLIKAVQEQQCTICTQSQKIALLESCIGIV